LAGRKVFLSLGSNLGDREGILYHSAIALKEFLTDIKVSPIYETEPLYIEKQPLFLNLVVCGYTSLNCHDLLERIQSIEKRQGRCRARETRNGPRTLDIDILLYGEALVNTDKVTVPHPKIGERLFVLVPLLDLEPDLIAPDTSRPYAESLERLERQGIYSYQSTEYNWKSIDSG
jgi:2-amino-4-hydroxy-6-hydroxymethyldihydropteridine diphosphokinase